MNDWIKGLGEKATNLRKDAADASDRARNASKQFAIAQACLRGVRVDIVIPEQSNYLVMDWAMRAHLRFFNHIAALALSGDAPASSM